MKQAPILLPCLACCLLTLTGCFHKDSSYEPGQNEIVSRLAGTEWVRDTIPRRPTPLFAAGRPKTVRYIRGVSRTPVSTTR